MVFMDFEKAHDNVSRNKMWQPMRRININEKSINVIKVISRYSGENNNSKMDDTTDCYK